MSKVYLLQPNENKGKRILSLIVNKSSMEEEKMFLKDETKDTSLEDIIFNEQEEKVEEKVEEHVRVFTETVYEASNSEKRELLMKSDPFGESFEAQCKRIREESPYGNLKTWRLIKVIAKKGCDLRQEQFAMQLISQCQQIFQAAKLKIWLKPYEIISTGPNCGLLECVYDSISLDSLNKKLSALGIKGLAEFFALYYPNKKKWKQARYNFAESMAGYSLISYLFQIKDRHNGNLLLDREGHIIHIDFDFLISNSPGGNMMFERAPFKFTKEFMDVMHGQKSECFKHFRNLMVKGFMALQTQFRKIMVLVEMMFSVNKNLPCFIGGSKIIDDLKARLFPKVEGSKEEFRILNTGEAGTYIDR